MLSLATYDEVMTVRHHRQPTDAVRITTVPRSAAEERDARQRNYAISMAIRTVCFLAAVIVGTNGGPGWLLGVLIAGAVFLPYVAVVFANSAAPRDEASLDAVEHRRPELGPPA